MRITKRAFSVFALVLALLALLTVMSGCKKEKPKNERPVITTQYTVSYYKEDGTTLIETRTFTHGDYITYPGSTDIDKPGHFTKWKFYNEAGEEVGDNTASRNLKAVVYYELMDTLVNVYDSVTQQEIFNRYYYYGDTFKTSDITVEVDIEKPGYVFKGFSVDGGETFVTEIELKESITIDAIYEPIIYKITFFDDETYKVIFPTSETIYGELTLPAAPEKEGYTFDGWYVSDAMAAGGSKRVGGKGDRYVVTGTTDFYAVYTKTPTESNGSNNATEK